MNLQPVGCGKRDLDRIKKEVKCRDMTNFQRRYYMTLPHDDEHTGHVETVSITGRGDREGANGDGFLLNLTHFCWVTNKTLANNNQQTVTLCNQLRYLQQRGWKNIDILDVKCSIKTQDVLLQSCCIVKSSSSHFKCSRHHEHVYEGCFRGHTTRALWENLHCIFECH